MQAPSTVPCVLVASATAIIRVTYSQAIGTRYIARDSLAQGHGVSLQKVWSAILRR